MTQFILIPTISENQTNSELLTVYSDFTVGPLSNQDKEALDKHRSLTINPIKEWGLSRQGTKAVDSVRRLQLSKGQKIEWLEELRLYCSGKCEGNSIELGFALAMLLHKRHGDLEIIATGSLGGTGDTVLVEPVSEIGEKLSLILQEQRAGRFKGKTIVFTPLYDTNNFKTSERDEVVDLRMQGIEVVPIQYLGDALEYLNPSINDPYLGLRTFGRQDKDLFFGRQKEIQEAIGLFGQQTGDKHHCRWLQLEGNSGVGKSSLVNAGLLPLIEQGKLQERTGYKKWRILDYRVPGERPLSRLAIVIANLTGSSSAKELRKMEKDERELSLILKSHIAENMAYLLVTDVTQHYQY